MADFKWIELLIAALGGGFTVKILDIFYQEIRLRSDRLLSTKHVVDEHLDPLLKAADELVGKLRSLADEDFKRLYDVNPSFDSIVDHDFSSLLFLLAKLWANIEIIRIDGPSVTLVKDVRGQRLQSFLDCIESRRVRIVDRMSQRAVGEIMLMRHNGVRETIPFIDFVRLIENDPKLLRWVSPVTHILSRTRNTWERQRLLQYGAVIHAMIDTLDPNHLVTSERPSYPNKLSKDTWRDLKYRVFGTYLKFVSNPGKYLGPPKKRGPKKV